MGQATPALYRKESQNSLYQPTHKCKLNDYLADIDEQAEEMYEQLVKRFAEQDGCTEQLKTANQMLWVRKMNNAAQRAREVVNAKVIYR